MKDKKGFTLTELTVCIALILALILIVVPNLTDMDSKTKDNLYDSKIKIALSGAYKYGRDNIDILSNKCTPVTIAKLIELDYISGDDKSGDNLMDPDGGSMNDITICVYYIDGKIKTSVKK